MPTSLSGAFTLPVLLAASTLAATEMEQAGPIAAGQVIYLSTRLESVTKSPGRKVVAGWSRPGAGIQAWEERGPYTVEACTALKVRKVVADKTLVITKDPAGIKHTLAGDWSGRIHAGEQECRAQAVAHPGETVRENGKLRYELPGISNPAEHDAPAQSTLP